MRRLFGSLILVIALFAALPPKISRAFDTVPCQTRDGNILPLFSSGIGVPAAQVSYQPGEKLLITIFGAGSTPATQLSITGPGAPGTVNLPYTFDYAAIPGELAWIFNVTLPDPDATWSGIQHCIEGGSTPVTFFNPGDNRVDGQPGDRIAVWCNVTATPPTLVVYGVGDNATNGSHGFWLATFNNADLLKAGAAGIIKNAGPGNGTISAMRDASGNFYVGWTGGIFNATGRDDFAKSFSCNFSS